MDPSEMPEHIQNIHMDTKKNNDQILHERRKRVEKYHENMHMNMDKEVQRILKKIQDKDSSLSKHIKRHVKNGETKLYIQGKISLSNIPIEWVSRYGYKREILVKFTKMLGDVLENTNIRVLSNYSQRYKNKKPLVMKDRWYRTMFIVLSYPVGLPCFLRRRLGTSGQYFQYCVCLDWTLGQ